ncbi:FecR domain-containing protein [Oculatella sp. LEGE 06141]|uniref:FecR domain-containing protein n=1 Tax=Oculatella sp. LEGE 06141 TaxID=1828648 RepID=UPI001880100B|nr:FecR domain-containing protein [Oculatella sp. LEGE 06141]MBE9179272.1 FecR domain-containing protein [Oculatella sp. LEGE 06141]
MATRIGSWHQRLIAGSLFSLLGIAPAVAQANLLTRAEVYRLANQVQIQPHRASARTARINDVLVPLDALQTGQQSRAELLFNEGSLARIGANAIFRFSPGTRSFQLRNGTIIGMIRPSNGMTTIITPEGMAIAMGTALLVQHDASQNRSRVAALTTNPAGPIIVSNLNGEGTVRLRAGEQVAIRNGVVGSVEPFNLQDFYQSCDLATDLVPNATPSAVQPSSEVEETLEIIRAETAEALAEQSTQSETVSNTDNTLCADVAAIEPEEPQRRRRPGISIPFPFPFPQRRPSQPHLPRNPDRLPGSDRSPIIPQ